MVLNFGFLGEYYEIRCFIVQIVSRRSRICRNQAAMEQFVCWRNGFGVEDWKIGRRYSKWRHLIRRGEVYVSEFYDLILEKRCQLIYGV